MMNRLLAQLRSEVLELRERSDDLTRQMWLLYATFEDVICINYPHRQTALLATSVDIDQYIHRPLAKPKSGFKERSAESVGKVDERSLVDDREIVNIRVEKGKTIIGSVHPGLNLTAGCPLSPTGCQTRCTCGADKQQQTYREVCLERQQIECVQVVSLDVREVSVFYKQGFESNDQSDGRVRFRSSGEHVQADDHVHEIKERSEVIDWKKQTIDIPNESQTTILAGENINVPLGNATMDRGDKRISSYSGQMQSVRSITSGQFEAGASLVSRSKRPGRASLPADSREGLYRGPKPNSRHSYPSASREMGVRSAAYNTNTYPGDNYSLAKAIPGRGVTLISPPFSAHNSARDHNRRSADREVRRSLDSLQTRQVNKSSGSSVCSRTGWTRQMYNPQDTVFRSQCAGDNSGRFREMSSARKVGEDTQLSPVTISSGYESDSIPSPVHSELDKCGASVNTDDDHTDYFSQSDTYTKSEVADISKSRDSFGALPYEVRAKQTPFIPVLGKSRFVRFGQHHNAPLSPTKSDLSPSSCQKQSRKLAKVTRSMYAIIHDLRDENARRKMRRHSCDAVRETHGCGWKEERVGVSLSPIVSPELRSRADVLTPQSEADELLSSPETLADDTPTHAPRVGTGFVSPSPTYSQIRKKQCAMSSVTQRLFHMDIKHQSPGVGDLRNTADRADDNCKRGLVRRESSKRGHKYSKGSDPVSDSEHIYEIIPGDESLLRAVGMGARDPSLSSWSTVVNLDGQTDRHTDTPPALPHRSYQGKMEPPIPPRCRILPKEVSPKDSANDQVVPVMCDTSVNPVCDTLVCDNDNQDYAVVRKVKTSDNVSLDGCLDRLDDSDLDSELYSRVCPPQPRQRNTFDFSDLTSETYCRLDAFRKASGIEEWSPGDMLNFIDGIHEQHTPKTRDNIYSLLQNSRTRAKFCESLEIETQLLHKGLLCTSWDSDDVMSMTSDLSMTPERLNCDFRQEIQPTYV